jgi:hypothetical protein
MKDGSAVMPKAHSPGTPIRAPDHGGNDSRIILLPIRLKMALDRLFTTRNTIVILTAIRSDSPGLHEVGKPCWIRLSKMRALGSSPLRAANSSFTFDAAARMMLQSKTSGDRCERRKRSKRGALLPAKRIRLVTFDRSRLVRILSPFQKISFLFLFHSTRARL